MAPKGMPMKSIALVGLALLSQLIMPPTRPQPFRLATYGTFVATTPCDAAVRAPLQIPTAANCELVQWSLVLSQDPSTQAPSSYHLTVTYGYLAESTYRFTKGGADIVRDGRWTIARGITSAREAVVFRLDEQMPDRSVALLKVDDNVLHLLDHARRLMVGNASWSYSLNRAGDAVPPRPVASTSAIVADSASQEHFEGRSPCQEVASQLRMDVTSACNKAKWELILNRDPGTRAPTTYTLNGTLYRKHVRRGRWAILRGTNSNPNAVVYQLITNPPQETLLFLRADQNILFFLDKDRNLMVGDADFSYTLNRR